jgi:hypothetical protein
MYGSPCGPGRILSNFEGVGVPKIVSWKDHGFHCGRSILSDLFVFFLCCFVSLCCSVSFVLFCIFVTWIRNCCGFQDCRSVLGDLAWHDSALQSTDRSAILKSTLAQAHRCCRHAKRSQPKQLAFLLSSQKHKICSQKLVRCYSYVGLQ